MDTRAQGGIKPRVLPSARVLLFPPRGAALPPPEGVWVRTLLCTAAPATLASLTGAGSGRWSAGCAAWCKGGCSRAHLTRVVAAQLIGKPLELYRSLSSSTSTSFPSLSLSCPAPPLSLVLSPQERLCLRMAFSSAWLDPCPLPTCQRVRSFPPATALSQGSPLEGLGCEVWGSEAGSLRHCGSRDSWVHCRGPQLPAFPTRETRLWDPRVQGKCCFAGEQNRPWRLGLGLN